MDTPQDIWKKLLSFDSIIMTLHTSPDGDSLGSASAIKYAIEKNSSTKVTLISSEPLNSSLEDFPIAKDVTIQDIASTDLSKYQCLLCVDESEPKMFSKNIPPDFKFPTDVFVINIDHHKTNSNYGNLNFVNQKASSCCEVLLDIFRELKIEIDQDLATRLLLGITTDTGFLRWGLHDGSKVIKDVAFLIDQGVDYVNDIMNPLAFNVPIEAKRYQGYIFSNLKTLEDKKICYVVVPMSVWQDLGLKDEDAGGISNFIQDIKGYNVFFTVVEYADRIGVSFRSKNGTDVSGYAQALGGGGHQGAAGARLAKMPLDQAESQILEAIKNR